MAMSYIEKCTYFLEEITIFKIHRAQKSPPTKHELTYKEEILHKQKPVGTTRKKKKKNFCSLKNHIKKKKSPDYALVEKIHNTYMRPKTYIQNI